MPGKYNKIIVHVGLHKTGTTSIQHACRKHRSQLLTYGIVFPLFNCAGKTLDNHSDPITAWFFEEGDHYGWASRRQLGDTQAQVRQSLAEQVDTVLNSGRAEHTLLLSGENICRYEIEQLHALHETLTKFAESVCFVVCVRDPVMVAPSLLQQQMIGGSTLGYSAALNTVVTRLNNLQRALGASLEVLLFNELQCHPSGVVGGFMQHCGLPKAWVATVDYARRNRGLCLESTQIISVMRAVAHELAAEQKSLSVENVEQPASSTVLTQEKLSAFYRLPGVPYRLLGDNAAEFQQQAQQERAEVEKMLGVCFPQIQQETHEPWQPETIQALEDVIWSLPSEHLIELASLALARIAEGLPTSQAAQLQFLANRLVNPARRAQWIHIHALGADYFRDAALAKEGSDLVAAYHLMSIARQLRPEGPLICAKITEYASLLSDEVK